MAVIARSRQRQEAEAQAFIQEEDASLEKTSRVRAVLTALGNYDDDTKSRR